MARKFKAPPPEDSAPLWMCTYGDLMSLLLCFFVMLFALSIIAPIRFQAVADAVTQDFTGVASTSISKSKTPRTVSIPAESAARSRRTDALIGGQRNPGPVGDAKNVHTIQLNGDSVKVIRFDFGSDVLLGQAQRELRAILPTLQGSPQKIMVKGYVTPTEEGGEAYKRDVDLAFSRALTVVDYFVSLGLKQGDFEVVVAPTEVPGLNLLPAGTDPNLAGASAEILLLNQTLRSLKDGR